MGLRNFLNILDGYSKQTVITNIRQTWDVIKDYRGMMPKDSIISTIWGKEKDVDTFVRIQNPVGSLLDGEDIETSILNEGTGDIKYAKGMTTGILIEEQKTGSLHDSPGIIGQVIDAFNESDKVTVTGYIDQYNEITFNRETKNIVNVVKSFSILGALETAKNITSVRNGRMPEISPVIEHNEEHLHKLIINTDKEGDRYYAVDYQGELSIPLSVNMEITVKGRRIKNQRVIDASGIYLDGINIAERFVYPLRNVDFRKTEILSGVVEGVNLRNINAREYQQWLFGTYRRDESIQSLREIVKMQILASGSKEFMLPSYHFKLALDNGEYINVLFRPLWFTEDNFIDGCLYHVQANPMPAIMAGDRVSVEAMKLGNGLYVTKRLTNESVATVSQCTIDKTAERDSPSVNEIQEIICCTDSRPVPVYFGFDIEKLKYNGNLGLENWVVIYQQPFWNQIDFDVKNHLTLMDDLMLLRQFIIRGEATGGKRLSIVTTTSKMKGYFDLMEESFKSGVAHMSNMRLKLKGFYRKNGVFQADEVEVLND